MKINYFVHGTTVDNEAGLATGWLPGDLSAQGIKQASALGDAMRSLNVDAVFCSDLKRAVDSAELFFGRRFPLFLDWRLRECHHGEFDGAPADAFKTNCEQRYIHTAYLGGESYRDVELRMRSFLADAQRLFAGKRIALVSHQAPQLAFDVILNGQTWEHAIANDWRKTGTWQAGWEYEVVETPR
ncbi:MAG: histidine phosphatase family protein [Thermomicrobiales bacterium]|nr:histidine phosphatase family protein [Thermomicrobiales bacterium]